MAVNSDFGGIPGGYRSQVSFISLVNAGAIGTAIYSFASAPLTNEGPDISYVKDSSSGDRFLINTDGLYLMTWTSTGTADTNTHMIGFSVNSGQIATRIDSIKTSDQIAWQYNNITSGQVNVTAFWHCRAGDVIRAHGVAANIASNSTNVFVIAKAT